MFYARKSEESYQTILEHLNNVADICERNCSKFTKPETGYLLGKLHDIGKYSNEFQERLYNNNIRVDHSTAGGKECLDKSKHANNFMLYKCLAAVICAHHSRLTRFWNRRKY